jgi:magnesium transporter
MSLEQTVAAAFLRERPVRAAVILEQMPAADRADVFRALPGAVARAVVEMSTPAAADAVARLDADTATTVLEDLPNDLAARLMRRLSAGHVAQILGTMPAGRQQALRRALRYPEGTAGALMDAGVMALPDDITTTDARVRIRREAAEALHYVYVVDRGGRLVGVVGLSELLRTSRRTAIRAAMRQEVERLQVWMLTAAVRAHAAWGSFHALPVVDEKDRLVGVLRYRTLKRLEREVDTRSAPPASVATAAMGELFQLGLAGLVESVAALSGPRQSTDGAVVGQTSSGGDVR